MLLCTLPALVFKLLNTTHTVPSLMLLHPFTAQSLPKNIHIRTYLDYQIPKRHEVSLAPLPAIEDAYLNSSHVRNHIALYEQAFEKFESCLKVNQHKLQIWKHALNEAANLAGDDSHTLSFRGENTRANFTSHLYEAFCRKQIRTYIDYELPKGDEISAALKQAIVDSYVSVVVFSEKYASSRWCLDELTHTLHCKKVQEQIHIPIFYKVEPSHVRNHIGLYGQAFEKYERHPKDLNESELIQKTVQDILQKLSHKYPPADLKGLVGIDDKCIEIEFLLRDFKTIGIWGMGGIGKSTIAKTIFTKYSSHYEGSCFLKTVREKSENGLAELHYKFISCLLKEEGPRIDPLTTFVLSRLSDIKVFVVLDDISTVEQLEYLVGEPFFFGPGSKILITTRDKHVLSKGVDVIYKVKELDFHQSLELFILNAFNTSLPRMGYEKLTKRIPHEDVQKVLRLSYDGLNHEEKNILLEIACFLKGMLKERLITLLDSYNFYGAIGIRTLCDKALIKANDHMPIDFHDLIQEMGWEIVHEESINEPGRRSRLWDCEEIYDVLANNKGTNKLEGIMLDVPQIKDIQFNAKTFKRMSNLRFLKFYSDLNHCSSHVYLPQVLEFLPNKIKYLEWYGYPLKSLPPTFCPENLVELHMPNSHVQKLWDGVQDLVNLKEINLSGCKQLKELPNFSKALNLKGVSLVDCERRSSNLEVLDLYGLRLKKIPKQLSCLRTLTMLRLPNCEVLDNSMLHVIWWHAVSNCVHSIIEDAYSVINGAACRFQQERGTKGARSLICFHGSVVPEWFRYRTDKSSVVIEVLQDSDLLGFSLCVVLQLKSFKLFRP
ncbi:hypothetical protein K1719_009088 [Acacia pycnantha]|nr:hypothetical protein K1719_009088 [Acacia pycnantha]